VRAYSNGRDRDGRRHAVLDEDFWAYSRHQDLPTVCFRETADYVGDWDPEHPDNCAKCVKALERLGVSA
jgi:hypothetical protein